MSMWDHVRSKDWPLVLDDDDGIRPAGPPDECFYCRAKVGFPHGRECVVVTKLVRYDVYSAATDARVGSLAQYEPYSHDVELCLFMLNDGSSCTDNVVPDIEWTDGATKDRILALTKEREEYGCICGELYFSFDRVVDNGPFIVRRATAGATT